MWRSQSIYQVWNCWKRKWPWDAKKTASDFEFLFISKLMAMKYKHTNNLTDTLVKSFSQNTVLEFVTLSWHMSLQICCWSVRLNAPCISTKNSTASSSVKFLSIIDNNLKIFDFKTPLDKWFSSMVFLSSANKFADSFHSFQNIYFQVIDSRWPTSFNFENDSWLV